MLSPVEPWFDAFSAPSSANSSGSSNASRPELTSMNNNHLSHPHHLHHHHHSNNNSPLPCQNNPVSFVQPHLATPTSSVTSPSTVEGVRPFHFRESTLNCSALYFHSLFLCLSSIPSVLHQHQFLPKLHLSVVTHYHVPRRWVSPFSIPDDAASSGSFPTCKHSGQLTQRSLGLPPPVVHEVFPQSQCCCTTFSPSSSILPAHSTDVAIPLGFVRVLATAPGRD